jgi:proline iminopeptidase
MDDGQRVYWEENGTPDGTPVLYLHGGPGGTLGARYPDRFALDRVRLVGVEQRGCGRSTPRVHEPGHDLDANTTHRLVADLELVRELLGIDAWLLNGVSWGSTLALAFARAHPARVLGLVLVAVTTTSRREVDWVTQDVGAVFPEAWDRLAAHADRGGRRSGERLVDAYARLLRHPDPDVRRGATGAWTAWEDTHVSLASGGVVRDPRWEDPGFAEVFATLVTHYWSHDGFVDPPLLDEPGPVTSLPGILVHGRQDVSSPLVTAWQLHGAWPGSELVVDEGGGHGGGGMAALWRDANERMLDRLEGQRP